jgi:NAD(P)-dependent dehydrogenase (short-subunit alcohol dehydrogenase family)
MSDPVSIITGAGSGIGRAIAVELDRLGHRTVLLGRSEQNLRETSQLLGKPSLVIPTDVTKLEQVEDAVQHTLREFGGIDTIINNAGVAPVLNILQTTPQIWHEVIDTNLSSAFYLTRAVWPTFAQQNAGVIVNISSMAARDPFPGFLAYGAAKAGLNVMGISLAREGAVHGIRVHTIAPGAVETQMFRNILSPQEFPTENTLSPQDVAKVVGQCVVGQSRYISGEVIWLSK